MPYLKLNTNVDIMQEQTQPLLSQLSKLLADEVVVVVLVSTSQ